MKLLIMFVFVAAAFVWVLLNMKRRAAWFAYRHIASCSNREIFENYDNKAIHLATWIIVLLLVVLGWTWFPSV